MCKWICFNRLSCNDSGEAEQLHSSNSQGKKTPFFSQLKTFFVGFNYGDGTWLISKFTPRLYFTDSVIRIIRTLPQAAEDRQTETTMCREIISSILYLQACRFLSASGLVGSGGSETSTHVCKTGNTNTHTHALLLILIPTCIYTSLTNRTFRHICFPWSVLPDILPW